MKNFIGACILSIASLTAQGQDSLMFSKIHKEVMLHGKCYEDLRILCKTIGHRLSGTPQAAKAVAWAEQTLKEAGADKVWLQPVNVPHWVRGKESLKLKYPGKEYADVKMLSLGNAVGTNGKTLEAPIVMANSFDEFEQLKAEDIKGKIVFFNYRFRHDLYPFHGYGDAGPYRWKGPNIASAKGAAGLIIRSVSTGLDDFPHTGSMSYVDVVTPIPAVAIGNTTADALETACKKGMVTAQLKAECKMLEEVPSYNVIAEITGTEHPNEYIVAGGHLDSWDVGEGAHDDGAGCVQSIEIIRTFKALNIKPKYSVRVVMFMNEENGLRGGMAYADSARLKNEKHILALESDAGGFSPRGIGLKMPEAQKEKIKKYAPLFFPYGVYDFTHEEGGADISPLYKMLNVPVSGLVPDPQRYFDLHHTANDVFEQVNHRELKMGAVAMTQYIYLVSQYGLN